jgi:protease I
MESDFYEKEIFYYEHRFPKKAPRYAFLSRLWGNRP